MRSERALIASPGPVTVLLRTQTSAGRTQLLRLPQSPSQPAWVHQSLLIGSIGSGDAKTNPHKHLVCINEDWFWLGAYLKAAVHAPVCGSKPTRLDWNHRQKLKPQQEPKPSGIALDWSTVRLKLVLKEIQLLCFFLRHSLSWVSNKLCLFFCYILLIILSTSVNSTIVVIIERSGKGHIKRKKRSYREKTTIPRMPRRPISLTIGQRCW